MESGPAPPASNEAPDGPPRWYACRTRARAEKRVERLFADRGIEAYLPRISHERQWADRRTTVQFPLFPGYVFGRFEVRMLHTVLSTTGVTTVVRLGDRPTPIRDTEIENVRRLEAGLAATNQPALPQPFREGEWVCVMSGPFHGLAGIVVELRGRRHVQAGFRMLGQGVLVLIGSGRLRRIPAPHSNR